jgi:hypothetical protein
LSLAASAVLSLCWTGCEQVSQSTIDTSFDPPVLLQATTSVSAINTDTINVGPTRKPEDILPISLTVTARLVPDDTRPVSSVQARIIRPHDNALLSTSRLLDDGASPDQVKGDGIYSAIASFQIQRYEIGVFTVEAVAVGMNDFRSNTLLLPLNIFRGNHAPEASIVEAADTVQLGDDSQLLTLRLRVNDVDGLQDITKVIFNSYRPDGSASGGNPFQMYDDGTAAHGDEKASDGIFSLIVTLPATTQPGTYRFEFQAFDRSNAVSTLLVHRITVKP